MNLPQYANAIEAAAREYEDACIKAKENMLKALAVAREQFFEDPDEARAMSRDVTYANERGGDR